MLLICKTTNAQTGTRIGANFPPQQSEDKTKIIFKNLTIKFKPSRELEGIRSLRLEFSNSASSDEKQSADSGSCVQSHPSKLCNLTHRWWFMPRSLMKSLICLTSLERQMIFFQTLLKSYGINW